MDDQLRFGPPQHLVVAGVLCPGSQRLDRLALDVRPKNRARSPGRRVHGDAAHISRVGRRAGIGRTPYPGAAAGIWPLPGGCRAGHLARPLDAATQNKVKALNQA